MNLKISNGKMCLNVYDDDEDGVACHDDDDDYGVGDGQCCCRFLNPSRASRVDDFPRQFEPSP